MVLPELTQVTGYVLAGGQSLRMGRDKAEVLVGGLTLLERARATLAGVCGEVVGVGPERMAGRAEALRWVADLRPGQGPMAGLEAALEDAAVRGRSWVMTLPVDVPLVPGGLLRSLAGVWLGRAGCRVGFVEIGGQAQPAVAMVHVAMLPAVRRSLEQGRLRLRPLLEAGAEALGNEALCKEQLSWEPDGTVRLGTGEVLDWRPTEREWERRASWFLNVNTLAEVAEVEAILGDKAGADAAGSRDVDAG